MNEPCLPDRDKEQDNPFEATSEEINSRAISPDTRKEKANPTYRENSNNNNNTQEIRFRRVFESVHLNYLNLQLNLEANTNVDFSLIPEVTLKFKTIVDRSTDDQCSTVDTVSKTNLFLEISEKSNQTQKRSNIQPKPFPPKLITHAKSNLTSNPRKTQTLYRNSNVKDKLVYVSDSNNSATEMNLNKLETWAHNDNKGQEHKGQIKIRNDHWDEEPPVGVRARTNNWVQESRHEMRACNGNRVQEYLGKTKARNASMDQGFQGEARGRNWIQEPTVEVRVRNDKLVQEPRNTIRAHNDNWEQDEVDLRNSKYVQQRSGENRARNGNRIQPSCRAKSGCGNRIQEPPDEPRPFNGNRIRQPSRAMENGDDNWVERPLKEMKTPNYNRGQEYLEDEQEYHNHSEKYNHYKPVPISQKVHLVDIFCS